MTIPGHDRPYDEPVGTDDATMTYVEYCGERFALEADRRFLSLIHISEPTRPY